MLWAQTMSAYHFRQRTVMPSVQARSVPGRPSSHRIRPHGACALRCRTVECGVSGVGPRPAPWSSLSVSRRPRPPWVRRPPSCAVRTNRPGLLASDETFIRPLCRVSPSHQPAHSALLTCPCRWTVLWDSRRKMASPLANVP